MARFSSINDRCAEKFPGAHQRTSHYAGVLAEVWKETFPNAHEKATDKMAARRERAKLAREWEDKLKDMTPEELEAMEADIPEWKRGALVVQSDGEEEEEVKSGVLRKLRAKLSETEAAQNFLKSEEY